MLLIMRAAFLLLLILGGGEAAADPIADLQRALPGGWRIVKTGSSARGELVIQRDRPVQIAGKYHPNTVHTSNVWTVAPAGAPTITLALRYRYEPRWSDGRVAAATAANARVGKELEALRARYKIDDLRTAKGRPLPETPDEQKRLAEFETAYQRVVAKLVKLPRCALGGVSLFDDERTYGQLDLMVDPPIAMREAFAVVELVKRRCR